jgi:succinyl-diaminopimelate desuccinylase
VPQTLPDPTDPVALTRALVRCRSVTPADDGALDVVHGVLERLGFTCERMTFGEPGTPDIDNLYARRGASGPNLCFAGHTDVVPVGDTAAWSMPPFAGEIRDGRLYGRGTADMKGAIACWIAALARHLAAHPTDAATNGGAGALSLLITGDEEGPSINGTVKVLHRLAAQGERLDACVVGEPSNPTALGEEIKIGRRGSLTVDLTVHGVQGHAAYPAKAENPVAKLIALLHRLSTTPIDRGTAHFEASNLQVTVLDVPNTAVNVIPAVARARLNIRYNDLHTRASMEEWVRLQCAAAALSIGARYDVAFSGTGEVFRTTPGALVDMVTAAVVAVSGRRPALTTGGGTSDARFIHAYCPVVEYGLVNATIHKVDEHVAVADLHALTDSYARVIGAWLAPK